jgi:predicted choloylglycine hydrolase
MRVSIVQCRGTPYEIGRQQGLIFAASRRGLNFQRSKVALPSWFDMRAEERFYAKFAPAIFEEISGIANALDTSLERACLFFGNGGLRPRLGGCSAVMSPAAFGRNYDFQPQNYGARLALVQPEGRYASIGFSELLTGRLDGMNEHGVTVALHLVGRRRQPGMSCLLMIRIVLDQCATTDEAVEMFGRFPHAVAYNYSLLDAGGRAAVVEAMPGGFQVRRGPALACTNHFQSQAMRPYNRALSRTSWTRLPPLEAWASQGLAVDALFEALNRSTSPAFLWQPGRPVRNSPYDCDRAVVESGSGRRRGRCFGYPGCSVEGRFQDMDGGGEPCDLRADRTARRCGGAGGLLKNTQEVVCLSLE